MKIYILMSNAGRVVSIYGDIPTWKQCDEDYASYLGKKYKHDISSFNCWLELWETNKGKIQSPVIPRKS